MPSKPKPEEVNVMEMTQPEVDTTEQTAKKSTDEPDINELLAKMDGTPPEDSAASAPPDSTDTADSAMESGDRTIPMPAEPEKPKRKSRKKATTANTEETPDQTTAPEPESGGSSDSSSQASGVQPVSQTPTRTPRRRSSSDSILTIESKADVMTEEDREATLWHEIRNAYRTKRILTGTLSGIENSETNKTVAILDYKGFRIIVPMKEMMFNKAPGMTRLEYEDYMVGQNKILSSMLGADIDFITKGIEAKSRSVVASRRDAMLKKRQLFYLNTDASGSYRIYENRIVQARVIAVAENVIRVEAFGVECSILARDLSWDWIGDARERYSVGDQILVRILDVSRNGLEDISIRVDAKSIADKNGSENLKKCKAQGKYAGRVVDVHNGVVYIRLSNGANAVAHSCMDRRLPGKKDDVSFAVTQIDEERGYAVGLITRIIKQNL